MLYALAYLLLRRLVVLATGSSDGRHNDIEVLVLRHLEVTVIAERASSWLSRTARTSIAPVSAKPRKV
jgi:hypothetical protein